MTERMTGVHFPGVTGWPLNGFQDRGRQNRAEMISEFRRMAAIAKQQAEAILAASDEDFVVETYLGSVVTRNREPVIE